MKVKTTLMILIIIPSIMMGLILCSEKEDRSNRPKRVANFELIQGIEKKKIIPFRLKDLEGKEVSSEDYVGSYVLINFWATWCGPCIKEIPSMLELKEHFKDRDFLLVGVSIDKKEEDVREYVEDMGMDYPILLDFDGNVAKKYLVYSIPATFLVDKEGYNLGKKIGLWNWYSRDTINFFEDLLRR